MDSLQVYSGTLADLMAPDEWYGHFSVSWCVRGMSNHTAEGLYLTGEQCSAAFGSEHVHKVMLCPGTIYIHYYQLCEP
jgi:hypothetical protein